MIVGVGLGGEQGGTVGGSGRGSLGDRPEDRVCGPFLPPNRPRHSRVGDATEVTDFPGLASPFGSDPHLTCGALREFYGYETLRQHFAVALVT